MPIIYILSQNVRRLRRTAQDRLAVRRRVDKKQIGYYHQGNQFSIYLTACGISLSTLNAVIPRPQRSKAILVDFLTILEASTGPSSKSHSEQADVTPARMSPIPAQRLRPPQVLTMKDLGPNMTSSGPFMRMVYSCRFLRPTGSYSISSVLWSSFNSFQMSRLRNGCKKLNSRWLGVMMVLQFFKYLKTYGYCVRQQMPSASNTTTLFLPMCFIASGKKACMQGSRPRPGPMTQQWIAFSQFWIFYTHFYITLGSYSGPIRCSYYEMNTGCTIISGEYALIDTDEALEQKIWPRSAPVLRAAMAEQKGAPVNSQLPPITPIRPLSPLRLAAGRLGSTLLILFIRDFMLAYEDTKLQALDCNIRQYKFHQLYLALSSRRALMFIVLACSIYFRPITRLVTAQQVEISVDFMCFCMNALESVSCPSTTFSLSKRTRYD